MEGVEAQQGLPFSLQPLGQQVGYRNRRKVWSAGFGGQIISSSPPGQHDQQQNGCGSLVLDAVRGELVNACKTPKPKEVLDAQALVASKIHSEAERRRRERINSHLATLRMLIPSLPKTDKASLLGEVISQVRDLKKQASEISNVDTLPTDYDELSVEKDPAAAGTRVLIRALVCCNVRPGLMTDIKQTLETLGLETLKVEISCLGGRIKLVIMITLNEDLKSRPCGGLTLKCVEDSLRSVMERPPRGAGALHVKKRKHCN